MVTPKTPISKSKTSTMADHPNTNDTNTIAIFTIGSKVEVSSDEPGFHGAWYVATLQDINIQNPKNKKGYFVKYDTLFEDDNLNEKLTEVVDCKFVRPLPPPEYCGVGFEVGDVIDAYYRDGWWIGVVVKKVINDNDNMGKYVVCFESPYEEVEFEKDQLRIHVDWVDFCWKVSQKKMNKMIMTPNNLKSAGKNAAQTSESNNDAQSDFTTPSKGPGDLDHICSHSTKKRTRSQKRAETSNSELVGAVDGSVTNGRNRTADSNSRGERSRSSTRVANLGNKGSKKLTVPVMERSGSRAITQDLPLEEHEVITLEISEADEGTGQQITKSGRPPKLPVNRNDSQEGNQKTRKRCALRDMTTDIDELPLSAWYQGMHPHSVLKRNSCSSPCDHRDESSGPLNQTSVNNGGTGDYQQQWPFIKQSPVWATVESLESYRKTPQKPHFTPLKERNEYFREGLAIAFVVTFADMVHRVSSLQLTDPTDVINDSLEILDELESHGFDVRPLRDRLNSLQTWKVKVGQLEDKLEKCKKDIEKCNLDKSAVEEETNQLEVKIRELQEKVVQNVKTMSVKNEEINKCQVSADRVSNQIMEWKIAFEKLVVSPL